MLFGPRNWKKTAQFVPGRTEVQCRERYNQLILLAQCKFLLILFLFLFNFYSHGRWVNSLDPSLNWDKWTEEEDAKLTAAIEEHGHCWSKVAAALPRRTDNMCRRYEVFHSESHINNVKDFSSMPVICLSIFTIFLCIQEMEEVVPSRSSFAPSCKKNAKSCSYRKLCRSRVRASSPWPQ